MEKWLKAEAWTVQASEYSHQKRRFELYVAALGNRCDRWLVLCVSYADRTAYVPDCYEKPVARIQLFFDTEECMMADVMVTLGADVPEETLSMLLEKMVCARDHAEAFPDMGLEASTEDVTASGVAMMMARALFVLAVWMWCFF